MSRMRLLMRDTRSQMYSNRRRALTSMHLKCILIGDAPRRACDRTTSSMRGLSLKIISGNSRRSENAQTHTHKHTVPNMKFKLHVLEFTKDKAQKVLQRIIKVFAEAFVSHDRHMLFALEESGSPRTTYTCES
jgi:hypothetical protein